MSTCAECGHETVEAWYRGELKILDPVPATYAAVAEHHLFPEDGDKIFQSLALAEHHWLCPAQQARRAKERAAQQAASARQKAGR